MCSKQQQQQQQQQPAAAVSVKICWNPHEVQHPAGITKVVLHVMPAQSLLPGAGADHHSVTKFAAVPGSCAAMPIVWQSKSCCSTKPGAVSNIH
jgi:hypothetical protein